MTNQEDYDLARKFAKVANARGRKYLRLPKYSVSTIRLYQEQVLKQYNDKHTLPKGLSLRITKDLRGILLSILDNGFENALALAKKQRKRSESIARYYRDYRSSYFHPLDDIINRRIHDERISALAALEDSCGDDLNLRNP